MDSGRMQVIGICRFSYPAVGGFQVEHETPEEREAFLYDPARLEQRFRYFETFTLPAIQGQSDPNFTFLTLIGQSLPARWRDRLMDGLSGVPQSIVRAAAPGPHRDVMKEAINSVREARDAPSLQFRLDDDDAVSLDFIAKLREAAQDCAGLITRNRHVALDFTQGYVARPGPEGIAARQVSETLWTPALAMSSTPNSRTTIMNFSHTRMGRFMPVVSLTEPDMFVRGHSDMNDSRQREDKRHFSLEKLDSDGEAYFRNRFGIDGTSVRAAFSPS